MLQRERKRRNEAAEAFRAGDRPEQAAQEEAELAILEEFMPEPLSEEELERIVDDAIAETGATSMRDMGRVMADVMPQIAGPRRRLGRRPARPREARLGRVVELRGERVVLRPLAEQDVPRLLELGGEPQVRALVARATRPQGARGPLHER